MTAAEPSRVAIACATCDIAVDVCAFCERSDCGHTICSRCLRTDLRESLAHPHAHGG